LIAGVDEAGRGPLAGPVVAAAVVLNDSVSIDGLTDSKKLSPKKRELLYNLIIDSADVGIGIVGVDEIEKNNILQATHSAMYKAMGNLTQKPDKALIDGFSLPNQSIPNEGVIKGDDKIDCIRAASIVAKVTRDHVMKQYDIIFPEYGFARHKGYGTEYHLERLSIYKACLIHRKTFTPVKDNLPTITWMRNQQKIGQWGQQLAALEYLRQGDSVVAMNHHCHPYSQIDIIAESKNEIIFAEVKTSAVKIIGAIEQRVKYTQLKRMDGAINKYLIEKNIKKDIRLDVFSIQIHKNGPKMKQIKDISLE